MTDEVDDKGGAGGAAAEPEEAPAEAGAAPAAETAGAEPEIEILDDDGGAELEELRRKLAEEHDRLLRTAAELDNFRKRARRDVEDASHRGRAEVLGELLPTIDALDLALKNVDESAPVRAMAEGVEMVRRQFLTSMKRFGLRPIESAGAGFDPSFHEAVSQIPSADVPASGIIEELRRGYMLGDRLLRASLVVVSAGPPPAAEAEPAAGSGRGEEAG